MAGEKAIDLGALGARAAVLAPTRAFPTTFLGFLAWLGVTPTPGQRVLCAVAFDRVEPKDLPLEDREMALRIFGPVETIPKSARGTLAVVAGARSGKSYLIGLHMVWAALSVNLSSLAPGQKAVALCLAVNIKLRNEVIAFAYGACLAKPELKAALFVSKGKREESAADSFGIRRPDGRIVLIEAGVAGRGGYGARGRSLVSAYLDEAAFFKAEGQQACDVDVYTAASPRVLPGGVTVCASTPWHEAGLLYDMWKTNHGKPTTALCAHAPTHVMQDNAFTQELIARERSRDPENAKREFDAEFVTSGTSIFFEPSLLEAAIDRSIDCEVQNVSP